MTQANFYQLLTTPIKIVLPKLIENIIAKGEKVQIVCVDDEEVGLYDALLWTYAQLSFIPHSTYRDKYQGLEPVYLTLNIADNPLQAGITFMFDFTLRALELDKGLLLQRRRLLFMYEKDSLPPTMIGELQKTLQSIGVSNLNIQEKNGVWKTA